MGWPINTRVPQVYLDAPLDKPAGVQFAPRILAGFDRVTLEPGEGKTVTIAIPLRTFQYWCEQDDGWKTPAGGRTLQVGFSSRHLPVSASLP